MAKIVMKDHHKQDAVFRRAQRRADRTGKPVKIWYGGAVYGEAFPQLGYMVRKGEKRPQSNPHVYNSAGKHIGKFRRKAAKIVARVVGGSVGKPKKNPIPRGKALAFKTKAAAKKWVREHRVKGYRTSIRKAAR